MSFILCPSFLQFLSLSLFNVDLDTAAGLVCLSIFFFLSQNISVFREEVEQRRQVKDQEEERNEGRHTTDQLTESKERQRMTNRVSHQDKEKKCSSLSCLSCDSDFYSPSLQCLQCFEAKTVSLGIHISLRRKEVLVGKLLLHISKVQTQVLFIYSLLLQRLLML